MDLSSGMFFFLAILMVVFALGVLTNPNPIYAALYLVLSMVTAAAVFTLLNAYFIAGVQLMVYAGAVAVLFVMVIMIFDLKRGELQFARGFFANGIKVFVAGVLLTLFTRSISMSTDMIVANPLVSHGEMTTKALARILFTDYIFEFEALGALLLFVAIGVVALSRVKGGTHAKS